MILKINSLSPSISSLYKEHKKRNNFEENKLEIKLRLAHPRQREN